MESKPSSERAVLSLWYTLTRLSIALWQVEQIFVEPERGRRDWLLAYA